MAGPAGPSGAVAGTVPGNSRQGILVGRMRTVLMTAALVAAAAGSAACGGGERLTQEEFVTKGNAICASGSDRIDAAAKEAFGTEEPSEAVIVAFARDTAIPEVEKQLDDLDDLVPPKETEATFDAALREARSALARVKANPKDLADDSSNTFAKADELVKAAGLDACAE